MKALADKGRTNRHFEVGDRVYLRLQPYRQSSIALRRNLKLAAKYYGPVKQLLYTDEEGQIRVEPLVIDRRLIKHHNKRVGQMLIQWTNYAPEYATWEDSTSIA